MNIKTLYLFPVALLSALTLSALAQKKDEKRYLGPLNMEVPHVSKDASVKLDYPIVYVRAPRRDTTGRSRWTEVGDPRSMEPGADLVVLHPGGKEEVLVPVKGNE